MWFSRWVSISCSLALRGDLGLPWLRPGAAADEEEEEEEDEGVSWSPVPLIIHCTGRKQRDSSSEQFSLLWQFLN